MHLRNVLITGASKGIGKAIAHRLLVEGHNVHGIARTPLSLEGNFTSHRIDLSDLDTLPEKLSLFYDVDAVVCNVGRGYIGNLEELSFSEMRSLMDLNFLSHVCLVKELLPHLKKKKQADIIFMGSSAALSGKRQGSIYCASKFALRGFAQSLRDECATSSVRITMIHPGMVRTPFFDTLSFGPGDEPSHSILPEDIAELVETILNMRPETVLDEVILSPKKRVVQKKQRTANLALD